MKILVAGLRKAQLEKIAEGIVGSSRLIHYDHDRRGSVIPSADLGVIAVRFMSHAAVEKILRAMKGKMVYRINGYRTRVVRQLKEILTNAQRKRNG